MSTFSVETKKHMVFCWYHLGNRSTRINISYLPCSKHIIPIMHKHFVLSVDTIIPYQDTKAQRQCQSNTGTGPAWKVCLMLTYWPNFYLSQKILYHKQFDNFPAASDTIIPEPQDTKAQRQCQKKKAETDTIWKACLVFNLLGHEIEITAVQRLSTEPWGDADEQQMSSET